MRKHVCVWGFVGFIFSSDSKFFVLIFVNGMVKGDFTADNVVVVATKQIIFRATSYYIIKRTSIIDLVNIKYFPVTYYNKRTRK